MMGNMKYILFTFFLEFIAGCNSRPTSSKESLELKAYNAGEIDDYSSIEYYNQAIRN